ncbi:hypothetical protein B9Z55_007412 [Caenorhabditis nigoni]|nr:hypothetical protein B9Z55_007412 [Caenorhabditis nigoni]
MPLMLTGAHGFGTFDRSAPQEFDSMEKAEFIQKRLHLQNKLQKLKTSENNELENRIPQMKKRKLRRRNDQMDAEVHDDTESSRSIKEDGMEAEKEVDCSGHQTPPPTTLSFDEAVKRYEKCTIKMGFGRKFGKTWLT